jgi:hypothetical protein
MDTKTTSAVVSPAVPLAAAPAPVIAPALAAVPAPVAAPADAAVTVEKDTADTAVEKDTASIAADTSDTAEGDTALVLDVPALPPFRHMDELPVVGLLALVFGLAGALLRKVKALAVEQGFTQMLNVSELKRISDALAKVEGQVADMQNALAREEAAKSRPKTR